jgi:AcrR family transcriptional regulator
MSSNASSLPGGAVPLAPARQRRAARQAETVQRLVEAAVDELGAVGYPGLTVRNVARRAGVAPATAYTYFSSKDHLIAEAFWQRLRAVPAARPDRRRNAAGRVTALVRVLVGHIAAAPALAGAGVHAMLADEPDVRALRDRIGAHLRSQLSEAAGAEASAAAVETIDLAFTGALLRVGTGHLGFDELADRMGDVARTTLGRTA